MYLLFKTLCFLSLAVLQRCFLYCSSILSFELLDGVGVGVIVDGVGVDGVELEEFNDNLGGGEYPNEEVIKP